MERDLHSGNIEVAAHREGNLCCGNGCPLDAVYDEVKKVEAARKVISWDDLKEICRRYGLKEANDFYGMELKEWMLEMVDKSLFTADCQQGALKSTPYTRCGSLMARKMDYQLTTIIEHRVRESIRHNWRKINSPGNFTNQ
ncbi:MAG: hypothetical protein UU73_C0003G0224 [Candidatus Daviesbacteria bacterium GW2011_GWA1_41_61]|uniref:Uncharacterized protein n=1 Tax=Candidatus Daviesbacteria bacterium GW2011_GWA2_40_9 TaxID=1618424 RepID=A0A0G0X840_9BACT|nr:MAG: hypothetical protein UU26_C0003G0002 [Candidatus Daviesbacteria bacterium GW2011_GWC1_40_9]KKR83817.1 MAG: hypothetical protein UU29_C0001G0037 [Candidatus Daviesbacteria bacterium GW2011_GWA2_40_9]KKR93426.1 MAG: hypothetical protein UU44_C0002G0087 [Candidatus Daviesbacteria bacterium GW2011_GWB1_41_15]KKS15025.1 MAG: hypothetical protein UU73_C0003G0224 [Candidatus Daviesbacteria bacterium GW2011_GWA1_41_61]